MIYLGGDSWPKEYRDAILMNNIHGARANMDRLRREGSGYAATHGPDFLKANDSWSQMLNFRYGPDGSVHVIDWYDKNQCHSSNPDVHEKTLGRIFKISYTSTTNGSRSICRRCRRNNWSTCSFRRNDWYVQHARRILAGARRRSEGARATETDASRQPGRHAQAARAVGASRDARA